MGTVFPPDSGFPGDVRADRLPGAEVFNQLHGNRSGPIQAAVQVRLTALSYQLFWNAMISLQPKLFLARADSFQ